jgi:Bax protein
MSRYWRSIAGNRVVVLLGLFLPSALFLVLVWGKSSSPLPAAIALKTVVSPDSIVIHDSRIVQPVVYSSMPELSSLAVSERKHRFIHLMLPAILLAQEKMAAQQAWVREVGEQIDKGICPEQDSLSLVDMMTRYRVATSEELVRSMHPHPVSIVLAQAVIESGWGTSRFCQEANNVYGMWSYSKDEKRIKAGEERDGKAIYLRMYDTLFESVYDYLYTIARSHAYEEFREARLQTQNPYQLIWYLSNYSESRLEYVKVLRNVIEYNDLTQYDAYELARIDQEDNFWKELLAL